MACYVLSFDGVADKIRIPSSSNNFSLEGFLKDLKNLINLEQFNINEQVPDTRDTVNIYYSTGENSILSNLAIRPFKLREHPGIIFKSVEHYFQWYKTYISSDKSLADKILNAETGAEARSLGRQVQGFNKSYWDSIKQSIMKKGLKASFDQNLDAKKALLSTENKVLTHLQEKGEWGELFPKLLTEVRAELQNQIVDNSSLSPSQFLFYSGGAKGSDTFWNLVARDFGFSMKNYYVQDYRELSQEEKNEIETIYQRVVAILDRKTLPYTLYAGELVRRDYLQVKDSDQIVAIGRILSKEQGSHIDPAISNEEVQGGTAYAITMGMLKNLPIFVYDLNSSTWKKFNYNTKRFDVFEGIPTLTQHSTLIGTREVEQEIIEPIMREVFEQLKVSIAPKQITYSPYVQKIQTDLTIIPLKDISTYVSTHSNSISTLRNPDLGIHHLGNPFSHGNYRGVQIQVKTVKEAVEAFEKWLRGEAYQDVEPERRAWILQMINSGELSGKELVYYTETIPDNSYGVTKYNYYTAPNHAHILLKLINEHNVINRQSILDNIYFKDSISTNSEYTFSKFKQDLYKYVKEGNSSQELNNILQRIYAKLKSIQEDQLDEAFIQLGKTGDFTAFAQSIIANPNIKGMDLFWELDSSGFEELTNLDADQEEQLEVQEPEPRYISKQTTYKTSQTLNKIHRYLEESLKVNPNAEKIKESDTQEALVLITQYLQKLGVNIILKDSDSEMEQEGLPKNTEAAVRDGAIYINRSRASLSSPIHELMHIVFAVMKQDNFDQFSSIVQSLRGIQEFKDIFEQVRQSNYYKNLIESDQLEETFVRYLSGVIDKTINSDDNFELLYTKVYPLLQLAIQKTFNIKDMPDIIEFLKSPLSYLTKYNSEIFKERTIETSGYSDSKYKVDISGKIMQFIQDNMGTLIQEGKCK